MKGEKGKAGSSGRFMTLQYWMLAVLCAFVVGYLIPWAGTREDKALINQLQGELRAAEEHTALDSIGAHASEAALYVAIGDYENATRNSTAFFDGIEEGGEIIVATDAASLSARREDVTALIRSKNALALYQLLDVYSRYEEATLSRKRIFTDPRFR